MAPLGAIKSVNFYAFLPFSEGRWSDRENIFPSIADIKMELGHNDAEGEWIILSYPIERYEDTVWRARFEAEQEK